MAGLRDLLLAAALCAAVCSVQALVEGDQTIIQNAPWMVQMVYYNPVITTMIQPLKSCAGVIVNKWHVISAAECFPEDTKYLDYADRYTAVRAGASARQVGGRIYKVESIVHHPKYNNAGDLFKPFNQKYDIAVIKMAEPFEFDGHTEAINVATTRVVEGTRALVSGWGSHKEDGAMAAVEDFAQAMRTATVDVQSKKSCQSYMSWSHFVTEAEHSLICAKPVFGNACNGDNGAALYVPAEAGEAPKLYGIFHGLKNKSCTMKDLPIFVDITEKEIQEFLAANGALEQ